MTQLTHVKWISANSPIIKLARNGDKLFLTKAELLDLHKTIGDFIREYPQEFVEPKINWTDSGDEL